MISFAGVSPGKKVSICDLTGGEGDQLAEMHAYIQRQGLEPIAYYNEITNKRYEVAKEKYGELPNFHFCNTDLFRLRCRNKLAGSMIPELWSSYATTRRMATRTI